MIGRPCTPLVQKYWGRKDQPYHYLPPSEIAAAFLESPEGLQLMEALSTPFDRSRSHPLALPRTKYGQKRFLLLRANLWREALLIQRNWFL